MQLLYVVAVMLVMVWLCLVSGVQVAARSLIQLFREKNPRLLHHKYRVMMLLLPKMYSRLWEPHHRATERHLPYEITQCLLPATPHRWTCPVLTPARQSGTQFIYPWGMEGWVDLSVGYILRWFAYLQTVTHSSSKHLIATWPVVEPTTSWS